MKKELLFVSMFIIVSSSVFGSNLLFDDELYSGDTVSVNNNVVTVIVSNNLNQIWLQYLDEDHYITKGSCGSFSNLRVCFDSTSYDSSRQEYKAALKIFQMIPVLTLTRTVDDSSINLDGQIEVTAIIENTGNKTAYGATFEDSIPEGMVASSYGILSYSNNRLTWTGDIFPSNTKEFQYTLKL